MTSRRPSPLGCAGSARLGGTAAFGVAGVDAGMACCECGGGGGAFPPPPSPPPTPFHLHDEECGTPLTEAECEAAATMAGKEFATTGPRTDRPPGCWQSTGGDKFKSKLSTADPCTGDGCGRARVETATLVPRGAGMRPSVRPPWTWTSRSARRTAARVS